jgi:endonuclease I
MKHTIHRFFFTVAFSLLTIIAISQETSIYTTGFESAEGFTAGTTYNNTTIKYDGPVGEQWGTYYGTASTTNPISGAMSMQMRFYTSAPANIGYTFMNFDLANVTKVTFKALNTSGNNVTASYSTDGGASYVGATLFTLSTTATTYTYNISATGEFANVRLRFMISLPGTPVSGSRITIDDITIFGITGGNVPPAISNIIQTPADLITSSTTVSVSANVTDFNGTVASVQLRWGNTADALTNTINMPLASGSTYTTASNIPAQANKSSVYYSIYAEDNDGASTLSPVSSYEVFDPATTTLPYSEPLDLNLGDCYTFSVSGSTKFWIHNSTNGTAQMNGFNSGETEEDWFILPGFNINLEAYSLTFDSWWNFGIDDLNNYLKVYYSTDYAGIGNPNNATWTELSYSQPPTSLTWTPSGLINLSGISGSPTWIGFKYRYEAGSYRYWQIDNLNIFDSSGPMLSSNPVSLSGFTYTEGAGPSASQTFTLSGQSLDGTNVSITAPVNFQVSLDNITYSNSITLTSYNGTNTTIYTRLNAGLTFNSYSGEITISGGGATSITVSLSGSVIPIPPSLKSFTSLGYQEDFATFGGLGFNSPPESFQLHSGNWKAIGMSDGIGTFDGIHTAGDFARGLSNGGVSTGGAFAFNVATGVVALGAQPTASDFNPGAFVLKIQNTSTEPVGEMLVSYDVYVYNDQEKSSLISFAYSYNDLNFTSVNELDYITDELPDATPAWEKVTRSAIISGLSFPVDGYIYLQWNCTDFAGGGSRDEFGITNIVLTPIEVAPGDPYISLSKPSLYNFGDVYLTNWSNVQFYDLLATNLTSNLVITAPADFYVSLDCKTGFTSSLTIVPSGAGNILNTRIFVKYRPSVIGNTSGVVTHVSTGATTRNLAVSGKGINNQIPAGYYSTATGTGADLITQLHNIIKNHTTISYAAIWTRFGTTDVKYNGTVWDMYSDLQCTEPPYEFILYDDQDTGSGSEEGIVYNREHSWCSSWWGGSTTDTMYTDMNHIIPADRYVNIIRSNNPYGIVTNPSYTSQNGGKSGPNVYGTAFSGTTFEPIDEYKGDLARNHFYMVVRYNSRLASWSGNANVSDIIDGSNYPAFKDWYINMLLEWHANDPVSQKEIDRNNAIYAIQGNRNPFIDNPNFVNQIWGGPIVPGSGDVNNDGFVNVLDVVWMVRYLNGDTPTGFIMTEADVTGDGLKNIADLTAMISLIMNGAK